MGMPAARRPPFREKRDRRSKIDYQFWWGKQPAQQRVKTPAEIKGFRSKIAIQEEVAGKKVIIQIQPAI